MTTSQFTRSEHAVESDPAPPAPRRGRRRPAPRSHPFWRFVFPVLVGIAALSVFALWRSGTKLVLDTTDGALIEAVTDPTAPGYEAFLVPTPTVLIAHTGTDGTLVGVSVVARTDLDRASTAVLIPAGLSVEESVPGTPLVLADVWNDGAMEALVTRIEDLFGFGFVDSVELGEGRMAELMGLTGPISVTIPDDLVAVAPDGTTTVQIASGSHQLDGHDASAVYSIANPDEPESYRVARQESVWNGWLAAIAAAGNQSLPPDDPLTDYLRSLATEADLAVLPTAEVAADSGEYLVLDPSAGSSWLRRRALDMVPAPIAPASTRRASVRLLDGTGATPLRDEALAVVVESGSVVSVVGNATSFDVDQTTVVAHHLDALQDAERISSAFGVDVTVGDDVGQPFDITVTVGSDWMAS